MKGAPVGALSRSRVLRLPHPLYSLLMPFSVCVVLYFQRQTGVASSSTISRVLLLSHSSRDFLAC
jgi:hypothetical protein